MCWNNTYPVSWRPFVGTKINAVYFRLYNWLHNQVLWPSDGATLPKCTAVGCFPGLQWGKPEYPLCPRPKEHLKGHFYTCWHSIPASVNHHIKHKPIWNLNQTSNKTFVALLNSAQCYCANTDTFVNLFPGFWTGKSNRLFDYSCICEG